MDSSSKSAEVWLMVSELFLGVILSVGFIILIDGNNNLIGQDYVTGFIRFYAGLSIIFFFAVFSIGIIGAIKLKRSNKIVRAIFYSIIFWTFSVGLSIVLSQFLYIFSLYIVLGGIIFGFNLGLRHNSQKVASNSI